MALIKKSVNTLDRDRVQNWRLTQHGYEQLLAMRAFNERAMLEGELAV